MAWIGLAGMMVFMALQPYRDEVTLAQALIQAYSPSRGESAAAEVFAQALQALGYSCRLDDAGNVIGRLGSGEGPVVMLNGHLDTVALGDEADWPVPPLSGRVVDGHLWGRGSVDMKASLSGMAFGGADAFNSGVSGTVIVTGVVQEEIGGLGARYLAEREAADVIIVGEPSGLKLMLGHRGRVELLVEFAGSIAHAARAELGDNALYYAAEFLRKLRGLELPSGGPLGSSSLTPSRLATYPDGANVVPGLARLTIDYRNIPGDEPDSVVERLEALAPGATISIPFEDGHSENGKVKMRFPRISPSYLVPSDHPQVDLARRLLTAVLEREGRGLEEAYWWFATDAPYLAATGAPVLGFGPGDPELAHTASENVLVSELQLARRAYGALVAGLLGGAT